jgi:hypothetical protein
MVDLAKVREDCGGWDEEDGCVDDYDEECPFSEACKKDALGE